MSARLRTGDQVIVVSGRERGKKGKLVRIDVERNRVLVEGLNLSKRHVRPSPKNPQGGRLEKEMWIHASNVMPVDPKTGRPTRVRFAVDAAGKKVRVAAKSGETIPSAKSE